MKRYLAIDIGASSGRCIIGTLSHEKLDLNEVYRFDNLQIHKNGHDCWDIEHLYQEILNGLIECRKKSLIPDSIGIDTWAVDYVLLDEKDEVIGDCIAYRDQRTEGMKEKVNQIIDEERLYQRTGIQYQPFNTMYQLMALKQEHPEHLEHAKWLLMIPEYFNFKLTGIKKNEYTNATSTNLVNAYTKTWDEEIIRELGLPCEIFHELNMPCTSVGHLSAKVQRIVGFDAEVMLPATHDTGSAFLAIPANDEQAVYISSGTWSLLGVENDEPITTADSMKQNFTNEGGAWYRYRYLKNIMGLWMIQSVRRELNGTAYVQGKKTMEKKEKTWSFQDLIAEAQKAEDFKSIVDVNRECFLAPASMIQQIKDECERTCQRVPESVGELMQCIYNSLALCYKDAIENMEKMAGKKFTSINIVGGGSQDQYLNQKTAEMTKRTVYAGPVEGTAIGNLIVQMIAHQEIKDLHKAREIIKESFEIREVRP